MSPFTVQCPERKSEQKAAQYRWWEKSVYFYKITGQHTLQSFRRWMYSSQPKLDGQLNTPKGGEFQI